MVVQLIHKEIMKMARFDTAPTTVTLSGLSWTEHYGCYRTTLGFILDLTFSYTSTDPKDSTQKGYKVCVGKMTLKKRAKDPIEAAAMAVEYASYCLHQALTKLPAVTATS